MADWLQAIVKWEGRRRDYEQRYQRFCAQWHLDPDDPYSAVEFRRFEEEGW